MATTIKLKNGSGAPLAGDLVQGEPALDLTNKRLYTEDSGGSVIEIGSNPSTLTTGSATFSGDLAVDTDTLFVDVSAGNVGIGTSSPQSSQKLHIADTSGNCEMTLQSSDSGVASLLFGDATDFSRGKVTYDNASDSMAFQVNNLQEAMRIDASGNVGIGTVSPSVYGKTTLVQTTNASSGGLAIIDSTTAQSAKLWCDTTNAYLSSGNSGSDPLILNAGGGNVGIGTDSPLDTLHVSGTGAFQGRFERTDGQISVARFKGNDTTSSPYLGCQTNDLVFFTSTAERMRIDSSGFVGIGTDNPIYELEVKSSSPVIGATSTSSAAPELRLENTAKAWTNYVDTGGDYVFLNRSDSTEAMRIDSSGNVGIGTSDPTSKLHVDGDIRAGLRAVLGQSGGSYDGVGYNVEFTTSSGVYNYLANDTASYLQFASGGFQFYGAAAGTAGNTLTLTEQMRIDSSGNLLVGTNTIAGTSAGVRIGSSGYGYFSRVNNTPLFCYNATTTTSAPIAEFNSNVGGTNTLVYQIKANGTVYSASDERLKTNIADAENSSSVLDAIKVRQFDWKESDGHVPFGLIAQELNEALPSCVSVPSTDEGTWAVDYTSIIPLLIKEIQDLRARVAQLEGA